MPASLLLGTITIDPICDSPLGADPVDDSTLEAILATFAGRGSLSCPADNHWRTKPRWRRTAFDSLIGCTCLGADTAQLTLDLQADYESLVG